MTFRVFVHNGYHLEWTPNTIEARSVAEARKIWGCIGAPSETRKFTVRKEA